MRRSGATRCDAACLRSDEEMSRKIWATWTLLTLACVLPLAACKQPQDTSPEQVYAETTQLETGSVVHITMYDGPPTVTDRHHILILSGKITIWSNDLVVVIDRDGIKHAAPLEWCSDIVYK